MFVWTDVKLDVAAIEADGTVDDNKAEDPLVDWDDAFVDEDGVTLRGIGNVDDDVDDVADVVDDTARLANAFVSKLVPTLLDTDETMLDPLLLLLLLFDTDVGTEETEGDIWLFVAICGVWDNGGIMPVSLVTTDDDDVVVAEISCCSALWVRIIDEELFDDDAETVDEADKDFGGESFVIGNDEVKRAAECCCCCCCCWTWVKEWGCICGNIDGFV